MEIIIKEIEELHEFFVAWFAGKTAEDEFNESFFRRLDPDFHLIQPSGVILNLNEVASGIRESYASNPNFRITIRNVQVQKKLNGHILATYEEWQRNALSSKPSNNARLSTVLFADTQPLRWVHVHETWMPKDIMEAGPYDF